MHRAVPVRMAVSAHGHRMVAFNFWLNSQGKKPPFWVRMSSDSANIILWTTKIKTGRGKGGSAVEYRIQPVRGEGRGGRGTSTPALSLYVRRPRRHANKPGSCPAAVLPYPQTVSRPRIKVLVRLEVGDIVTSTRFHKFFEKAAGARGTLTTKSSADMCRDCTVLDV